jgi:peroxin-5
MEQSSSNFQMNDMKQQLHHIEPNQHNWAMEFDHHRPSMSVHPAEFETIYSEATRNTQWNDEFRQQMLLSEFHQLKLSNNDAVHNSINWNEEFNKYKGKQPSEEWKKEFEDARQGKVEGKQNWSEEFNRMEELYAGDTTDWQRQFQEIWNEMKESKEAAGGDWASDFKDIFPSDMEPETIEVDPVFSPCEEYIFEKENSFLEHPDPYQAGIDLISGQGSLSLAALAFEAAVQRDVHNSNAWMHLGKIQAENEKEEPAIAALQRSVQENPNNLEALMNIAISYTNEGRLNEAYASLHRWLRTQYPQLQMPPTQRGDDMHDLLTKYYLQAVHQNPSSVDSSLQIGLGLLFYNVQEYDKSIDCFTAALSTRPNDYLLWNRLGATLSNSGKSKRC